MMFVVLISFQTWLILMGLSVLGSIAWVLFEMWEDADAEAERRYIQKRARRAHDDREINGMRVALALYRHPEAAREIHTAALEASFADASIVLPEGVR
jgi:hypothetical protein